MIKTKSIYKEITYDLQRMGMPAHVKGFYHVRKAILMVYEKPTLLDHMMDGVYAAIAEESGISSQSVERNIRAAIELTWLRGDMEVIISIFHNTVDGRKARPTNKEFIALMVDYIKINHME